jgi:hypothetical protein
MDDDPFGPLRRAAAPPRRSIVELIVDGVVDPELAGLAWLLVEARLPVIVGGSPQGAGKTTLLEALLDFLPPTARRIDLAGAAEDFAWLPEAETLGWQRAADPRTGPSPAIPLTPATGYLVAAELSEHLPIHTWGRAARTLVRAASMGYGIAATIRADRLEDVHDALRDRSVGLTDDELTYLGLVLIMRADRDRRGHPRRRVVAAHYARPVGRDEHGHTQRLAPAVLASRSDGAASLDHFEWGVMPELAIRLGRKAGDLEREQAERAAILADLAATGSSGIDAVRAAIRDARRVTAPGADRLH